MFTNFKLPFYYTNFRIRSDLEDTKGAILSACPEEGPLSVVLLALTGRASLHLHNGVIHVGDENTYVS